MFSKAVPLAALFLLIAPSVQAEITVSDPYIRSAMASAKTAAAFMVIENAGNEDDRLLGAASDIAARVELHSHVEDDAGVMRMRHAEDGFVIPAAGAHVLERGMDHVMFMGLDQGLAEGETVSVTLTFEQAGDIVVEIPVALDR